MMAARKKRCWFAGYDVVVMLFAGLLYGWSIFVAPLEAEFGWTRGQTSLAFTLGTIVEWFQDHSGTLSGVMLMCYGAGGMVLGTIASVAIEAVGWRKTFVLLGALAFILMMAASFVIRKPKPQEMRDLPDKPTDNADTGKGEGQELNVKRMVKTASFRLFFFWNITLASVGLTMAGHASPMAQEIGMTTSMAAAYAGVVSLFNGLGRVLFGITFDRYGRRLSMLIVNSVAMIGAISLLISYQRTNGVIMVAAFVLLGLGFGGAPISSAGFVRSLYGEENYGVNVAFMNLSVLIAAFVGPYISGILYQKLGYIAVAAALCGFAGITLLIGIILAKLKIRREE